MIIKTKKHLLPALTGIACILSLSACCKKELQAVTVVKDCTGTYLRTGNVDYLVCNYKALDDYEDRSTVEVSFQKISNCSDLPQISCEMLHEHEGLVRVICVQ